MNIFLQELRAYRKSTITWTMTYLIIILVFISLFPAFSKEADITKKILENFPDIVKSALGISIDSFFSLIGFYSFIFLYIVLCGSIQAMNYGLSILSKESRDRTVDFLLSKPISRLKVITTKLLSVIMSLIITNIIYLILSYCILSFIKTETFPLKTFFLINITLFIIQLIFFALGLLMSLIIPKIKSVISITLATVFGFFIIDLFNTIIDDKILRYFTPYKYFDPVFIIINNSYETTFVVLSVFIILTAITASYFIYTKKDFLI